MLWRDSETETVRALDCDSDFDFGTVRVRDLPMTDLERVFVRVDEKELDASDDTEAVPVGDLDAD